MDNKIVIDLAAKDKDKVQATIDNMKSAIVDAEGELTMPESNADSQRPQNL